METVYAHTKVNRFFLAAALALLAACLPLVPCAARDNTLQEKLDDFARLDGDRRVEVANAVMRELLDEGYGDDIVFSTDTHPDTLTMTVCYYAAEYLHHQHQYDECIRLCEQALPLTKGNADYTWQSETLNLLMLSHFYKSQYVDALRYGQQCYAVEAAQGDYERISSTLNTIAGIYLGARQPWQAEQYALKAIEADSKTASHPHANAIYGVAGEVFMGLGQYDKARSYISTALQIEQQRGDSAKVAVRQTQLASVYVVTGDTAQAHALLREAIPVLAARQLMPSLGIALNALADVMRMEGRTEEAAHWFDTARQLFRQTGDLYNESHSLQGLFRTLRYTKPDKAMAYLEHFAALKDTIYYNDMRQQLTTYSAQFRNEELSEQNEAVRTTNRAIITGGLIVLALLLAALAFLVYAIRLKSRSNQFLLELQNTRENFFTNITHEFRTPLTVILGLSRKLQGVEQAGIANPLERDTSGRSASAPLDQEQTRHAGEMIEREGSQLLSLINQLLDLTKIQTHIIQPTRHSDNVVAYLNMVMESFYDFAHSHGIELVFAPRENVVEMDFVPDYMQKIVNNLVSNAVKFTPQGGHVYMTTRQADGQFVIQVADDGVGIGSQQLQHIFEPFYQGGTDSQNIGTGVGLALVQQIVTAEGGTVDVASTRGKGTVFTVTLPLRHGDGQHPPIDEADKTLLANVMPLSDGAKGEPELVDSEAKTDGDQTRLLIIEDNRDVAYYIGSQLKDRYDVYYATNGRIGLEKAETLVPDLIITDLMMPEMDGLDLCRTIRQTELLSHIPIIIITARSTKEDLLQGIEAGADAYLMKPFHAEELKLRVEKLLDQRRLLREKLLRATQNEKDGDEQTRLLSPQDAQFIGRLTDIVYSLMGRGQVDIDSVASALCLSPSQLRRKVQAITGKTPVAYVLQIRLSNAKRLIDKNPELSIADVAYKCGFSDQSHFSHAFQKAFNISPSQWAKRAK